MKKSLILFALLTLSVGMWAETQSVSYRYPVYKTDGVATSGIKEWKTGSVTATVVENATERVTWNAGWYVVKGADITLSKGAVCNGAVNLILANGAKLTATGSFIWPGADYPAGIQVSGDGNSLTIYGESVRSGQLIAKGADYAAGIGGTSDAYEKAIDGSNITINGGSIVATGGEGGAGIGGGRYGSGSNIIINGGAIKATSGEKAAGIGGGHGDAGTNITINGGRVIAIGGYGGFSCASGIGCGDRTDDQYQDPASYGIKVATTLVVKADDDHNPPQTKITNTGDDIAGSLKGLCYVIVESPSKEDLFVEDFVISNNHYKRDGDAKTATVTLVEGIEGAGEITVTYKQNGIVVTNITEVGVYDIYAAVSEGTSYKAFAQAKVGTLTIEDAPQDLISYRFPVYNTDGVATSGIKEWEIRSININKLTEITSSSDQVTWNAGWYVVKGADITLSKGAVCNGAVNLILADGAKLTATGTSNQAGIRVCETNDYLTIYGQSTGDQMGQLIATGNKSAGIGGYFNLYGTDGENITINGGAIIATGGEGAAGIGGSYYHEYGATMNEGSNITINGGVVTAIGGSFSAGIGGGENGYANDITINGGVVTANGNGTAAGIGGAGTGFGSYITINDGMVTANGGYGADGIGNGSDVQSLTPPDFPPFVPEPVVSSHDIFVNNECIVKADGNNPPTTVIENNGGDLAESLKGKQYVTVETGETTINKATLTKDDFVVSNNSFTYDGEAKAATVALTDGITGAGQITVTYKQNSEVVANPTNAGTYDIYVAVSEGTSYKAFAQAKVGTLTIEDALQDIVSYRYPVYNDNNDVTKGIKEWKIGSINVNNVTEITSSSDQVTWNAGWYVVKGADITLSKGAVCNGAVNLILADGAKLTATGGDDQAGIQVSGTGNSLTIYCQTNQSGQLIATGGEHAAGIGGGDYGNGSNITINGGKVTATGNGQGSAAIGGGYSGSGSNITINGGTVIATAAGYWGAGIGGGLNCSGSNIVINGGEVTATGGPSAAGIGGGRNGSGTNISINGGTIIATGGENGAGIGGGSGDTGNSDPRGGKCSDISIKGGIVVTSGGKYGAGIGSGYKGSGSNITITDGDVTATGGDRGGAGIGGGRNGSVSNIVITGGDITALGGSQYYDFGAGIGSGYEGDASSNILVDTWCTVKADGTNPPTTVIVNDGTDLAKKLEGKKYATVESPAKSDLTVEDFVISNNTATYDGEAKSATVAFKEDITGAGTITITYKQGDEEVTPVNAGTYDIYVAVTAGVRYNAFPVTKLNGQLTITKATLTSEDFTYNAPEDLDWDGNAKSAAVTFNSQNGKLTGCGEVTVKYQKGGVETPPVAGGDYTVSIDVAEGTNYNAAAALTKNDWKFTIIAPIQVSYIDENGEAKTVDAWEVTSAAGQVTWNKSWYVVNGEDVQLSKGAVCTGEVHLILADGAKLTTTGGDDQAGIRVSGTGNSLTIYGQVNQSGQLIATGGEHAAGIGGGKEGSGSNITINGGIVIADGHNGGAGIGGGLRASGSNITINGGNVKASSLGGDTGGAGIGGGNNGSGSNITINGGIVEAKGERGAAGIGGGEMAVGSDITITGGTVTATSGGNASGIGGGYKSSGSNIKVATTLIVKADGNNPPTTVIENNGGDLAESLKGKQYVTIEPAPKSDLTADDFEVGNNTATYDGEVKTATVAFKDDIIGAGQIVLTYKQNSEEVTPVNAGTYDIYVSVTEGERYKAFPATKFDKQLTITKATLTADNFTYKAPEDLDWDGNAKSAAVTFNSQDSKLSGCGEVTVKYQKGGVETSPVAGGDYTVSIDVAEGTNYNAAAALTKDDWKFTIIAPIQVSYIDENGEAETVDAWEVTSAAGQVTWNKSWYVVNGEDVQLSKGAICNGAVNLILADGATLTATGDDTDGTPGIQVSDESSSLTIYSQTAQTGQLIANGGSNAAGIGGGKEGPGSNITINGGVVTTTGGYRGAGIGGGFKGSGSNITINGGKVTAKGGDYASGIGSGTSGNGSSIIITEGTVIATGGLMGAGIGGGSNGSGTNITITGGTVTATGGGNASGIGGGYKGSGSNITINGGTVTANGGVVASGIGGGWSGSGSNITITGGTVTANGGADGAGIGNGRDSNTEASNIFVTTSLVVKADNSEHPSTVIENNGEDLAGSLAGKQYATIEPKGTLTVEDFVISNNSVTYNGEAKAATVAFKEDITGAGTITVTYKQNGEEVTPKNVGEYDIYVAAAESANYNAFESTNLGTLTIAKADLTADNFTYTAPDNLNWDGDPKSAAVTFNSQNGKLTGCGDITIKYNGSAEAPSAAGDYTVSIDVAEGDNYNVAEGLTSEDWKFTIEAPVTFTLPGKKANQYATICLPQPIASVTNGTLYKISYGNVYEVHFVEETNFAADPAGTPYLVQANADGDIVFTMTDAEPVTEPVGVEAANGFVASLQDEMQDIPEGYDHLLVSGGELHSAGPGCQLSKNHAYINVNYVPETEPVASGAPRRVTLYNAEAQSPTGLGQSAITNHKSAMKVVKDGRFMIIRDNMKYTIMGVEE